MYVFSVCELCGGRDSIPSAKQVSDVRHTQSEFVLKNEEVAFTYSNSDAAKEGGKTLVVCMLSCFSRVRLCATPWTLACRAPLAMECSRQEYWSGFAISSSSGSSQPRDQTHICYISCIGRCVLYSGASWEAPEKHTATT